MTGNLVEVILRLRDEASGALRQVAQAAEEARARIGSLSDGLSQVSRGLTGLGSSLGAILGSAGLTYALKSAADAAFEAQTEMQVLARTAAMAGVDFSELRSTLDPLLKSLGVLPEQAAQATAQLLRAGLSVEQIAAAFQAGAASALAAGRSAAEGINNVAMAFASGQSIYLNYIGIAENIGPVMQQVASSMQGASEEAIRQAQNQAALNVILNATKNEIASLPDLLGGYAGAQNRLNQSLYEAKKAIGEAVLPYLTALIELVNRAVEAFNDLDPETKRLIGTGAVAAGGILGLATAIGLLLPVIDNVKLVLGGLKTTLLALAANPITLVIAGAAAIAVGWARSADTADETRKRWALLAQAAIGLYDILKGVAQSIAGLFSSVGQLFSTIAAAFSKVLRGDFVGAWQEVQRGINLEVFATKFEAANRSLTEGWRNLSSTARGEVLDSTNKVLEKFQDFVDQVRGATKATEDYSRGQERAKAGADSNAQAAKSLTDALDVLKKRYELGQLSLGQYLAGLRGLLGQWETHLRGLKEGTDEWKHYADAVLAAKRAIADATAAASRMTRAERERRVQRDWSGVITGPELRDVQGWADAALDAVRLEQFDRIGALIANIQERLAQGGLSEPARKALEDTLRKLEQAYADLKRRITRAVEEEGEARLAAAQAESEERVRQAEEAAQALIATERAYAEATIAQLRLIAQAQKDLEESFDPGAGLKGLQDSWERTRAMFALGLVDEATLREEARFILDALEGFLAEGAESLDVPVLQAIQRLRDELVKVLAEARVEVDAKTMEYARSLVGERDMSRVSDIVGDNVRAVEGLAAILQANLRTGTISASEGLSLLREALDATEERLKELYTSGQITAEQFLQGIQALERYEGLARQLAEAAAASVPALQDLGDVVEESFIPAEDYYAVAEGAAAYLQELQELNRQVESGAISLEEYQTRVTELRDALEGILPVWEAYIAAQEAAGVSTEDAREALERLRKFLAQVGEQVQRLESQRLSRWASDLASDISRAANAVFGLLDAFSAPSFGQGLGMFARGLSGIMSFIPGLNVFAPLVDVVGGVLGRIVDGILGVFDSGWGRVQEAISKVASRFKLISREAFQSAVETYQESYLFGLIRVTKYRINEALMESLQAIAGALEGGVLSGVRNAAKAFLRGAADWANALREGIREAIESAIVEAVIQGAIVKGALGQLLDQLTAALATGDFGLAQNVIRQIAAAIPGLVGQLEGLLAPLRGALAAFGGDSSATGPGAIQYQLPTVTMATPNWVHEMGEHVATFGAWVEELVSQGIRVRVVQDSWEVRAAAIGG